MTVILIVEDERPISRVLEAYCKKAEWDTLTVQSGGMAMDIFREKKPDVVLLDVMLPEKDGWTILNEIRSFSDCPVIMLTALDEVNHRLKGFESGADDYIPKPFHGDEVVARIRSVLKRSQSSERFTGETFGDLNVDPKAWRISIKEEEVKLTPKDTALFIFLSENANHVFSREELIEKVWGMDYEGSDRAVDLAIKRIRKELQNRDYNDAEIRTIRGQGYQFHV